MRVLGIDYGNKNIGLALSDKLGLTSLPFGLYRSKNKKADKAYFKNLVEKHEITEIVIGLPLRMDGTSGSRAETTREFGQWLESILGLPVFFWDERLTTKETIRILEQQKIRKRKKKEVKDQISASLILSSFLENKRIQNNAQTNS